MSKSLIDVLWIEIKRMFYTENHGVFDIDIKWQEYQIKIIKESGVKL